MRWHAARGYQKKNEKQRIDLVCRVRERLARYQTEMWIKTGKKIEINEKYELGKYAQQQQHK